MHERSTRELLFRRFEVLIPDRDVAWRYGRTFRYLRNQGLLIGTNDLWIAATALVHEMPLVTRKRRRVPAGPGARRQELLKLRLAVTPRTGWRPAGRPRRQPGRARRLG